MLFDRIGAISTCKARHTIISGLSTTFNSLLMRIYFKSLHHDPGLKVAFRNEKVPRKIFTHKY